jgi:hypothetical protein
VVPSPTSSSCTLLMSGRRRCGVVCGVLWCVVRCCKVWWPQGAAARGCVLGAGGCAVCAAFDQRDPAAHHSQLAKLLLLGQPTTCAGHARTHEHFGGGVVHVYRLQDGRAVVGDRHLIPAAHALQDFVHALGAQCGLYEVCDRDGAHKRGLQHACNRMVRARGDKRVRVRGWVRTRHRSVAAAQRNSKLLQLQHRCLMLQPHAQPSHAHAPCARSRPCPRWRPAAASPARACRPSARITHSVHRQPLGVGRRPHHAQHPHRQRLASGHAAQAGCCSTSRP